MEKKIVKFEIAPKKNEIHWMKYVNGVTSEKFAKSIDGKYYYGNKTDEFAIGKKFISVRNYFTGEIKNYTSQKAWEIKIYEVVDDEANGNLKVIYENNNDWQDCWIDCRNFVAKLFN